MNLKGQNSTKPIVLSKFYPRPFTDRLLVKHKFLYEGKKGCLWWYDPENGIWISNGEDFIKKYFRTITDAIDDTLKKRHIIDEIIEDVKGCAYGPGGLPESDILLIPFKNGVYDLKDDKFRGYCPEDYFTWQSPWNYDPESDCKYLEGLVNSMVPEKEAVTLWELMAYALWRGHPFQKFFMLLGGGRNGKSTYTTIFTRLLGQENISNVSLGDIQNNRFAGSSLHRKLANISGEIDYNELENTRLLKQLTGGDYIEADRKYLKPVKFVNHAKLIFLTNQVPKTRDTTEAFYRRVFLIDFPYQFEIAPSIDMRIRAITADMAREYEGLLYRVLQHLKRLIKQDFKFTRHQDIKNLRNKYNYSSNPIVRFLEGHCERTYNYEDFIYKYEFEEKLNAWLREKGFNTYTPSRIGTEMKELGYDDAKKEAPEPEKRYNAWVGVVWKNTLSNNPVRDVKDVKADINNSLGTIGKVPNCPDNLDNLDTDKCTPCSKIKTCMMTKVQRELCGGPNIMKGN